MQDPEAGVAEMRRVTRPGGVVAACVWDYAGEMPLLRAFWDDGGRARPGGGRGGRRAGSDALRPAGRAGRALAPGRPRGGRGGRDPSPQPRTRASTISGSRSRRASDRPARMRPRSTPSGARRCGDEYRLRLSVPDGPVRAGGARVVRGRPGVAGALLVGGASTRFGSPKALARFEGETLADARAPRARRGVRARDRRRQGVPTASSCPSRCWTTAARRAPRSSA